MIIPLACDGKDKAYTAKIERELPSRSWRNTTYDGDSPWFHYDCFIILPSPKEEKQDDDGKILH